MDLKTIEEEYNNDISYITTTIKMNAIIGDNIKWFQDIKYLLEENTNWSSNEQAISLYEILCQKKNINPYDKITIQESIYKLVSDNYRHKNIIDIVCPVSGSTEETINNIKKEIDDREKAINELKKYIN